MAVERIMGTETELGITSRQASGFDPVGGSIFLINALPANETLRALWDYAGENPLLDARGYEVQGECERPRGQDNRAINKLLLNGGRLYVDGAHPEYSTPETTNARDLVLFEKAGERLADRRLCAPREGDPAVGAAPDVLAGDGAPRLLVEHRTADFRDLALAEPLDGGERRPRVGDVVGDQHPRLLELDQVGHRRQDHRHLKPRVDAGVELDVHREGVLHAERVAEGARDEHPAAGDREHHVGAVAVVVDRARQLARADAEVVPAHDLPRAVHEAASESTTVGRTRSRRLPARGEKARIRSTRPT